MKKLFGLTTAMVTPFQKNGDMDVCALKRVSEFYIARGVHALYVCGTTGEFYSMTLEERMTAVETVLSQAAGRVVVYAHVGAVFLGDTQRLAEHAHKAGCDGIGVMTPVFHDTNAAEMEDYLIRVARHVPEDYPVYLYNIPQRAANDLSAASVGRVAQACPNVVGIKYSYPDVGRTSEYLQTKPGFSVVQGCEPLMLAALTMGCDGVVSGVSSALPDPFVKLYEAYQRADILAARAVQHAGDKLKTLVCGFGSAKAFKAVLEWRGVDVGCVRGPAQDLSPEEKNRLFGELDRLIERLPTGLLA